MLKLHVGGTEVFNDTTQMFDTVGGVVLEFEHSLVALSTWEAKWEKPFLTDVPKSPEETISYLECMCLNKPDDFNFSQTVTQEDVNAINDYIGSKQSATWFSNDRQGGGSREIITGEVIYYYMVQLQIPSEYEHWHINRLFTLIRVISEKNAPKKKMTARELADRNSALNAKRRLEAGTRG